MSFAGACAHARIGILLCLLLCAPAGAAQFAFGVFGDVPYSAAEESQMIEIIAEMNRQPLAFAMHVGDLKSAQSDCSNGLYIQRREWFDLSHHPFVYVPGDNEWQDCKRAFWARRDPLERLAKLRDVFFDRAGVLGQRPLEVSTQAKRGYPEHLRWRVSDVVFVTLNVPGPANNAGMRKESAPRTAAVLDWLRQAFRIARENKLAALVVALQANLWTGNSAFAPILDTLAEEAQRYSGEVVIVHGDTHWHRVDRPLVDRRTGVRVRNVTRLEVFGSPFVNWVHVSVAIEQGRARFTFVPGSDLSTGDRQRAR